MLLILLLYAFFGLTFTLGKITLFYASPFFIVGTRMLISGLGIGFFLYVLKSTQYWPEKKDWPAFMQVTLFGLVLPYCLRAWGLQYVSSTKAAFLFCLMPFFTALFSYFFHQERLTLQKKLGLLIGFLGMMPTLFTGTPAEFFRGSIAFISLPEAAIMASVASFSYNFIALKNLIQYRSCPVPVANAVTMLFGGILSLSIAYLAEPLWIYKNPLFVALLIATQILVSNIICLHLQAHLLKTYSATLMAFASLLAPLCASFYGWFFLGEILHLQYLLSLALVLIGLTMFYYSEVYSEMRKII